MCEAGHQDNVLLSSGEKGKITILKVEGKTVVDADELDEAISEGEIVRYGRNK